MRVALEHTGPVGVRCARILLAERELQQLGVTDPRGSGDGRVTAIGSLDEYDVFVTDSLTDLDQVIEDCLGAGVSCVLWADDGSIDGDRRAAAADGFAAIGRTLVTGANLGSGLAPVLARHEEARSAETLDVSIAWTEPGRPLRKGEAVPFPEPVGGRWGDERTGGPYRSVVVPVPGDWAAALARVTSATRDGIVTRVVGVSDLAERLEAIALAAAVIAVSDHAFRPGVWPAYSAGESYLARTLRIGLDVAAYSTRAG